MDEKEMGCFESDNEHKRSRNDRLNNTENDFELGEIEIRFLY